MAPQESLSFDTAPQTPTPKKQEENLAVSKTPEANLRFGAFTRCNRIFLNDAENPAQDREGFFDFLEKQPNREDYYTTITSCSEDILKKMFNSDELGFKGMCSPQGLEVLKRQK